MGDVDLFEWGKDPEVTCTIIDSFEALAMEVVSVRRLLLSPPTRSDLGAAHSL